MGRLVEHFGINIGPLLKIAGQDFSVEELGIDDEPDVFSKLEVEDGYFLRGTFKQDLLDILRMAEWARESGAEELRLEAA